MGFLTGSGKKAAKISAKATMASAEMQASSDRLAAQSAVSAQQTMIAQQAASARAAETLSTPQERVDVQLATDDAPAEIDPTTGRRKTTRGAFQTAPGSAGIRI